MKQSDLLEAAVNTVLWDGNSKYHDGVRRFLCMAVGKYAEDRKMPFSMDEPICKFIEGRLGGYLTVTNWLNHNCPEAAALFKEHRVMNHAEELPFTCYPVWSQVQAYRKRWALSLVEELRAAGR